MTAPLPVGWGFAPQPKAHFDRALAKRDHDARMRRQTEAMHSAENRSKAIAARRASFHGRDRCMHFQFALWAAEHVREHGAPPTARVVRETFGICTATAYNFLADLQSATRRLQERNENE